MKLPDKLSNAIQKAIPTTTDFEWREVEGNSSTVISFYDKELKCRLEVIMARSRTDLNENLLSSDDSNDTVNLIVHACQGAWRNLQLPIELQQAIQTAIPSANNIRWYELEGNQSSAISFYDNHLQCDVEVVIEGQSLAVLSKALQSASEVEAVKASLVSLCQRSWHTIEEKHDQQFIDILNGRLKKTSSPVQVQMFEPKSDTSNMKTVRMKDASFRDYPLANGSSVGQWLSDYNRAPPNQRLELFNAVIQGLDPLATLKVNSAGSPLMQAVQMASQYYQRYKAAQKNTFSAGLNEVNRLLARCEKAGNDDYLRLIALHVFFGRSFRQGNTHKPRNTEHSFVAYFMEALKELGVNLPELPPIDPGKDYLAPGEMAERQAFVQALAKLNPTVTADVHLSPKQCLEQSIARAFFLYTLYKEASFTIISNRSTGLLHATTLVSVPAHNKAPNGALSTPESFSEVYYQVEGCSVWQRLEAFFDPKKRWDNTSPGQNNYSFVSFLMNQLKSQDLSALMLPKLDPNMDYHQSGAKKARVEYIEKLLAKAVEQQRSSSASLSPPGVSANRVAPSLTIQIDSSGNDLARVTNQWDACSPVTPADRREGF